MTLAARVDLAMGTLHLEVSLEVDDGEIVAIVGPNGSGKTTLLRTIIGAVRADNALITLGERVLDDTERSIHLPTEQRRIGLLFQDHQLFETMSVRENVAVGLRATGTRRAAARREADGWLDRMGLAGLGDRSPSELSGGQGQRAALARTLAPRPEAVLLDEPLAALDVSTRAGMRRELRTHLHEVAVPAIMVTHDVLDAHAIADRVIVVERGRVTQTGTLPEITRRPRSRYVAELVGTNLITGVTSAGTLVTPTGTMVAVPLDAPEGPSFANIRPGSLTLHRTEPEGSARNVWSMRITELDQQLDRVRVGLRGELELIAELTPAGFAALAVGTDEVIWVSVKASEIAVTADPR